MVMFASTFFDESPLLEENQERGQAATADNNQHCHPEQHQQQHDKTASIAHHQQRHRTSSSRDGHDHHQRQSHHESISMHRPHSSRPSGDSYRDQSFSHRHSPNTTPRHHFQSHHHHARLPTPPAQQGHPEEDGGYTDLDVLCEKGGRANQHMGNRVFLRLVQRNKELYRKLVKKQDKDILIQSIIMAIQQNGGRFRQRVSPSSADWQTVSWERCYQKTRQALREPDRKVHKAAVAANEAAALKAVAAKQAALREAKPAARAVVMGNHSEVSRRSTDHRASLTTSNHSEASRSSSRSSYTAPQAPPSSTVVIGATANPSRALRRDLLEDDDPMMDQAQNFSVYRASSSSSQHDCRPPAHGFGDMFEPEQRYARAMKSIRARFEGSIAPQHPQQDRHQQRESPPSLSGTSSSTNVKPRDVGSSSSEALTPLPLHRGESAGLPLETLLEQQDSLNLSHLLDVVGDHKRREESQQQQAANREPKNTW